MESFDSSLTFSDLFQQNLSLIEEKTDFEEEEEEDDNISEINSITAEIEDNILNDVVESLPEDVPPIIEIDNSEEIEIKDFIDYSFELNNKQKRCLKPILDLKITNIRFIAIQICTYYYHDLYKFFFYIFKLVATVPIPQYLTDVCKFIQQVGHYKQSEYFENIKIAFSCFYRDALEYLPYCYLFFNSQYNTGCLSKNEIINIISSVSEENAFSDTVKKIIFYEPFQFDNAKKKINRLEKEIERLKKKLKDLTNFSLEKNYEQNHLSYINDYIILDVIRNSNKKIHARRYNEKFVIFCSIACLFGRRCYNFLRRHIPLCSITFLRTSWCADFNNISNCIFNIDNIFDLIQSLNLSGHHATLAVDAASFQKIKGESLLKKMPALATYGIKIDPSKVYSNVFVFLLQPLLEVHRTIPIHVQIHENGNANLFIIDIIKNIISHLSLFNIIIDFVATDGDRFYDFEHFLFFHDYIERVYNFDTFESIYNFYVINQILLPNSDVLHILKAVRIQLINKDFIFIDFYNGITLSVEEFEIYDFTKVINDTTSNGGMKDSYPLLLFSFETFKSSCQNKKYVHAFYILGYCFLAEAVRNPILSNKSRLYYLEVSFWVILYFYHQNNLVKNNGVHTKIGLIRTLNTIITIMIAIQKFVLLKIDRVGTHPLECFYGLVRMMCYGNHNFINILNSIVRSIYIKNKLIEIDEEITIKGRDNIGGVSTKPDSEEGVLPKCLPNEFFCIMLRLMKGIIIDSDVEILEAFINEKTHENSEYSSDFMKIYLQGPFAGSNIASRYKCNSDKKKNKEPQPPEQENKEEIIERPTTQMPSDEEAAAINLLMGEKPKVIEFYSFLNSNSITTGEYKGNSSRINHFFNFTPKGQ